MGSKRKNRGTHHTRILKPTEGAFGSRKRALEPVKFVYPRNKKRNLKNGIVDKPRSYHFGGNGEKQDHHRTSSVDTSPREEVKAKRSKESIEEILYKKKKAKQNGKKEVLEKEAKEQQQVQQPSAAFSSDEEEETVHDTAGHLSGMSVEDAVRDKVGCRPRANSTDGELKLPQRGLCDERTVLEHYRWTHPLNRKPKGFQNLGNTCFLNSTLQCLTYLPPFCQSVMALNYSNQTNGNATHKGKTTPGKKMTKLLCDLFRQVHSQSNDRYALAPKRIVKALPTLSQSSSGRRYKFRPGRQEDAHEFLVHLLDSMNEGELCHAGIYPHKSGWRDRLPIPRLDETTFVHRVFGGYLRSQVKCTDCGYCSNTYDPFLDLSLEVSRKSCQSVANAFAEYTRKEQLDAQNKWKCSGCKKRVRALKQLTVFRPPLSLCIQLKRFAYSAGFGGLSGFGGRGNKKISKPIQFPARMKLPLSDGRSCGYSLTGIVIHVGGSASSGHYTACVKQNDKKWFHMDDSYAEAITEASVLKQRDAYLLFYSREEVKLEFPSPPIRSMSAVQARELGRARQLRKEEVAPKAVTESSSTTSASDDDKNAEISEKNQKLNENRKDVKRTQPNVAIPGRKISGGESSSSSSSSSSSEDSDSDSSTSSSEDEQDKKSLASHKGKHTSNLSPEKKPELDKSQESSSGKEERTHEKLQSRSDPTEKPKTPNSSSSDDSSEEEVQGKPMQQKDVENESSSDSSSNDSGDEKKKKEPKKSAPANDDSGSSSSDESGANGTPRRDAKEAETPMSHLAKRRLFESSEKKKPAITKIVLDRGTNRGKVEVMIGPRKGKKKTWKPRTIARGEGEKFELLGNVQVGRWDEEGVDAARTKIVKKMEKTERSRKRKMFTDRWDAMLDQGKTKKVKTKDVTKPLPMQHGKNNAFQRIQLGIARMNRGKAKGYLREKKNASAKQKKRKGRR